MPSPTVRRRRLASELRRLRVDAAMTLDDAAAASEVSKSTISRIESRQTAAKILVVRALLAAYGVTGERADALVALAREANQRGWWEKSDFFLREQTGTLVGLEAEASMIRDYQPLNVPGLLQTPDYSRAVQRAAFMDLKDQEIDKRVELRKRRQERLVDIHFLAVVTQEVLLRPIGSPEIMREQVEHLIEVSNHPNIQIAVLPLEAGAHSGSEGPFTILSLPNPGGSDVVYLESAASEVIEEDISRVGRFRRVFENLLSASLDYDTSRRRMRQIAKDMAQ